MKVFLICSILLFQTLYAETSAMVAATLKINQKASELALQERKVRACTTKVSELHESVSAKQKRYMMKSIKVKELRAEIVEENGMLAVCQQKLGIAERLQEQSKEISFDLAHKNKDTEKILTKRIGELTVTMEELRIEFQQLSVTITRTKNDRDHENDKGEELDARVAALNINMEAVLKALKQAQADAEEEQLKRIEISAKRLATYIRKWDSEEAKALKLEVELEKLTKLLRRLTSVALMLATEFQNTKLILLNTGDEIVGIDLGLEFTSFESQSYNSEFTLDDAIDQAVNDQKAKKDRKKSKGKKKKAAAKKKRRALLSADDQKILDFANKDELSADDIEDIIYNLVQEENEDAENKTITPKKKSGKKKSAKKGGSKASVEKTKSVLYTDDEAGNKVSIDIKKNSLQIGTKEYRYVTLTSNPLSKISARVAYFREQIGKTVRMLTTCNADVVSESSELHKLESNLVMSIKELECAMKEIKIAEASKETCEIELQEVQEQILLIEENNKALAAEVDAGNGKIQAHLASLREYRAKMHRMQLNISGQHGEINDLEAEIQTEKDHEAVVIKMIANIEATIKNISDKTADLQIKTGCPTLQEQENDQKLVLVKGAYTEANERVVSADKSITKKKLEIQSKEAFAAMTMAKINNMRLEINKISESEFLAGLPDVKNDGTLEQDLEAYHEKLAQGEVYCEDCEKIKKYLGEEDVASGVEEIVPFYKNQWTWLLMILSFAGGYIGFGYLNKKSDSYQQFLAPNEIALEKI